MTASSDGTVRLWPSNWSLERKVAVAQQGLSRAFTEEECQRFFRDDPDSCPQTLEALFALFEDAESP